MKAISRLLGVFVALTVLPLSVSAQTRNSLVYVDGRDSGTPTFIDTSTIERKGQLVGFWFFQKVRPSESISSGIYHLKVYQVIDCRTGRWQKQSIYSFNSSGQTVETVNLGKKAPIKELIPNSINEALFEFTCK